MKNTIFEWMCRGESVRKKERNPVAFKAILPALHVYPQEVQVQHRRTCVCSYWGFWSRTSCKGMSHTSQHKLYCKLEMTGEHFHPVYSTLWEQQQSPGLPWPKEKPNTLAEHTLGSSKYGSFFWSWAYFSRTIFKHNVHAFQVLFFDWGAEKIERVW